MSAEPPPLSPVPHAAAKAVARETFPNFVTTMSAKKTKKESTDVERMGSSAECVPKNAKDKRKGNQQEIWRDSTRIFLSHLLPSWVYRSQEDQEDYGVDGEIEILNSEGKASGFIFKVQLKGTTSAEYNNESKQLNFQGVSVEKFKYLSELEVPLIFVVCDVEKRHCYWTVVQGNRKLEEEYKNASDKEQQTFTIKIPLSQKIERNPESVKRIVEAVESATDAIFQRKYDNLLVNFTYEHIARELDVAPTERLSILVRKERQHRFRTGQYTGELIHELLRSGDIDTACKKAESLLESPSELPEIRFLGGFYLARCIKKRDVVGSDTGTGIEAAKHEVEIAKHKVKIAERMLDIVCSKECDPKLKQYSYIFAEAAKMNLKGREAWALEMYLEEREALPLIMRENNQNRKDEIDKLYEAFAVVEKDLEEDFRKICNKVDALRTSEYDLIMPYALIEVTESIFPFIAALRLESRPGGDDPLPDRCVDRLFDFLPSCLDVVRKSYEKREVEEILWCLGLRLIYLEDLSDAKSVSSLLDRYMEELKKYHEVECINKVRDSLRKKVDSLRNQERQMWWH
jgi:hypothetical protein